MKIIQSFAEFEEGNYYLSLGGEEIMRKCLNFYSFLLSYLTLQKYYGKVTMFCNQKAHDSFIKYIPYNDVKILENPNDFKFWSYYKVDAMRTMKEKFIHVDSDVFIFDDLYAPFIKTRKYDVIVQDTIPARINASIDFVKNNKEFLLENNIIDYNQYDGRCFSCGTLGITPKHLPEYIRLCDVLKEGYLNKKLVEVVPLGMILEELSLYLFTLNKKLRIYEVLPHDEVLEHGVEKVGDLRKYTHMWFGNKFKPQIIKAIKLKIEKEFPDSYHLIEKYERDVLNKEALEKYII